MSLFIEEKYLISVLEAALKDKAVSLPSEDMDIKKFCTLCMEQCVAPFAYTVLKDLAICEKAKVFLNDAYEKAVLLSAKQDAQAERIYGAFSENKIKFIPLKGIEIKSFYAHPECRTMSDIDIYINEEDFSKANKIMCSLGFEYRGRLSYHHEYYCNGVAVELHFALWSYGFENIKGFRTLFDYAVNVPDTSMYRLSREAFYVFLIAHLAKHLRTSGIGVRAFIDVYVYSLRFGKKMDWGKINNLLAEMGLDKFASRLKELIGVWFYGKASDTNSETMTKYIMSSYTHGTRKQEAAALLADGTNKKQRKLYLLFPPMSYMQRRFLILKKLPFLYPFCWVYRLISAPFSRSKSALSDLNSLNSVNEEDVKKASEALSAFGLVNKSAEMTVSKNDKQLKRKQGPAIDFESEANEMHHRRTLAFVTASCAIFVGSALLFCFVYFVKNDSSYLGNMLENQSTSPSSSVDETVPSSSNGMMGTGIGSFYVTEHPYRKGLYTGWMQDDLPNGSGELKISDEQHYVGNFKDGEFSGIGILTIGKDEFSGEFVNGKLNGIVKVTYNGGNIYEGEYKDGEQTGKGKFIWENGDCYEGDFVNGVRSGQGKYTWVKNGKVIAVYEGEWQDNTQCGKGKYTAGTVSYEGDYLDGVFHGEGVYTWNEGEYIGKFEYGEKNDDHAIINYKKNDKITGKYEGPIENGVINGKGTYTMSNGDIVKGTFVDGLLEGDAQYYYASTKKWINVKYQKGKIIKG